MPKRRSDPRAQRLSAIEAFAGYVGGSIWPVQGEAMIHAYASAGAFENVERHFSTGSLWRTHEDGALRLFFTCIGTQRYHSPNAFATRYKGDYFAWLNNHAFTVCRELSEAFVCMPTSFIWLDKWHNYEKASSSRFPFGLSTCSREIEGTLSPLADHFNARRTTAHILMQLMIEYMLMHELSHVLNGHVDYFQSIHPLPERQPTLGLHEYQDSSLYAYAEQVSPAPANFRRSVRQMEWEADRDALMRFLHPEYTLDHMHFAQLINMGYKRRQYLSIFILAVLLVHHIWLALEASDLDGARGINVPEVPCALEVEPNSKYLPAALRLYDAAAIIGVNPMAKKAFGDDAELLAYKMEFLEGLKLALDQISLAGQLDPFWRALKPLMSSDIITKLARYTGPPTPPEERAWKRYECTHTS